MEVVSSHREMKERRRKCLDSDKDAIKNKVLYKSIGITSAFPEITSADAYLCILLFRILYHHHLFSSIIFFMFFGRLVGHLYRWALIPLVLASSFMHDANDTLLVPDYVKKYGMYLPFSASSV